MKASYRSDFVVNKLYQIFCAVYGLVFVSWVVAFTFRETVSYYLVDFYHFIPLSNENKMITIGLFIVAPFILMPFFDSVVSLISMGRNLYYTKTKFDIIQNMPILSKMERSRGGSESNWTEYFLMVSHPVSYKRMTFEIDKSFYDSYHEGDMVEVCYHPSIGSILYLQVAENKEKQEIIREEAAKRGNFKWYIFGRRVK